jgi:putative exporter of polyketide antibiotics
MKQNKQKVSAVFLILGMTFLVIGIATDNTAFSWAAVAFVLISLVLGGRWMRPRRK